MKIVLSGAGRIKDTGRRLLTRAVEKALGSRRRQQGELCVIFVDEKEIRRINKEFLDHQGPTDVISFDYPPQPAPLAPGEERPFGDVFICWEVARRQARDLGHSLTKEAVTLAVHGTLHLVGYDDRKPADRSRMFARQDRIVREIFPREAQTGP